MASSVPTRRLDMWYAGAAPQNRWTVGFRLILAIPQIFVVIVLSVVVFFVVVIGWFAALVTGRLPLWAHEFISSYVRWIVRVEAYVLLLTDRYPPFSLEDEAYPARPVMPQPGPLNRLTVLFRFFVALPASVFAQIVWYGLTTPLIIGVWFVILVRGSMPPTLYLPYASLVRYNARLHAFFVMLTAEYPWGMLGDGSATDARPTTWAPPPAAPAPPPEPPQAFQSAPGWAPPSTAPEPPSYPSGPGAMPPPSTWERAVPPAPGEWDALPPWGTLLLEGAARGWMIFAIVWGSVLFVIQDVARLGNNNSHRNNQYLGARPGPAVMAESPPIVR